MFDMRLFLCRHMSHDTMKGGGRFSLVAGVGHTGGEQQCVDGRLSDEQQERSVGLKHLPVQVDGATDRHHGGGCRRLASLLVYLQTEQGESGLSC